MSGSQPLVWVLADERAGDVAQMLGVAEALGLPFIVKQIHFNSFARLPNLLRGASLLGVQAASRAALMIPPWPDLVICAGRRLAPVAHWIKKQCGAKLVQIMDPGFPSQHIDLVVAPCHDRPKAGRPQGNRLNVVGTSHRVTAARLAEEGARWRDLLPPLPRPWLALLVGGATKNRPFDVARAQHLGQEISRLAAAGNWSVLATTSRRTGEAATEALAQALPPGSYLYRWGDLSPNPFFGLIALADCIVVTGDSTSMCSEACAGTAPVYIYAPSDWIAPKHGRLHEDLYRGGYARPLGEVLELWDHPQLNPANEIAAAIRARLLA